jgi:hypothetical protein
VAFALSVTDVELSTDWINVLYGMPFPVTSFPTSAEVNAAVAEVRVALAFVVAPSMTVVGDVYPCHTK